MGLVKMGLVKMGLVKMGLVKMGPVKMGLVKSVHLAAVTGRPRVRLSGSCSARG